MTADGGVTTGPSWRLVGERGPEAIVPLWRLKGGGGGASVNVGGVTINAGSGDPETIARMAAQRVYRDVLDSAKVAGLFGQATRGRLR